VQVAATVNDIQELLELSQVRKISELINILHI
jgi:hypothetical protein